MTTNDPQPDGFSRAGGRGNHRKDAARAVDLVNRIYCWLGLHVWVHGRGYIDLGGGISAYYDGKRCSFCGKCKDAPSINEHL